MFRKNVQHLQMPLLSSIETLSEKQLKRLDESWAGTFYRDLFVYIDEDRFAVLYSDEPSRSNIPINVLTGLEVLKSGFGWSDEEMYDAFCYNMQVRYALGYRDLSEGHFELRSVYNFRQRLGRHMQETGENLIEQCFEQVTDEQLSAFQLKTGKLRMDSTQIASNIREMSRLQLLVEVVQRVHRMLSETDQARYTADFAPYPRGSSGQYTYRLKGEETADHLQRIGELMSWLVNELADTYAEDPVYQMLKRVFSQREVEVARRRRRSAQARASGPNLRAAVEATVASLKCPFGNDKLPVRGRFRMSVMMIGAAVMANVRRIQRYTASRDMGNGRNLAPHGPQSSQPMPAALSFSSLFSISIRNLSHFFARQHSLAASF